MLKTKSKFEYILCGWNAILCQLFVFVCLALSSLSRIVKAVVTIVTRLAHLRCVHRGAVEVIACFHISSIRAVFSGQNTTVNVLLYIIAHQNNQQTFNNFRLCELTNQNLNDNLFAFG